MKRFLIFMVLALGTFSFALSQSFSTSGLNPGESSSAQYGPITFLLTHSSSQTIIAGNSVSCNAGGLHTDNHYLRVFDLAGQFEITDPINITSIDFGIEQALSSAGTQPATINIYTLVGVLTFSNLTLVASQPFVIPDQNLSIMNVPISAYIPAGSVLVVEIFIPNGQVAGNSIFVGSNNLGETGFTYLAAADCGVPEPMATAQIGFPNMHLVLNVNGAVTQDVPLSNWAILIGIILITAFAFWRFRR